MWQLAEAVRGLADGCKGLGIPVTGGNVSLYNQTGATAIHPTPVIGVLGVHDDVTKRLAPGLAPRGRAGGAVRPPRAGAGRGCRGAGGAGNARGPCGVRSPISFSVLAPPPLTLTPNDSWRFS